MKTFSAFSLICLMALAGCDRKPEPPPFPAPAEQPAEGGIFHWLEEIFDSISLKKSDHYDALRQQGLSHNEALAIMKVAPTGTN